MKNIAVTLLVVFSFSSFNFGQSILHPDKFGLAFYYGYSSTQEINVESATIVISPWGPLDLFFSLAGKESISSQRNQISAGYSYHINNDINNLIVPALTMYFSYSNSARTSGLGLGAGLNINAYRARNFSLIPVISIGVLYKASEGNSYSRYGKSSSSALVDYHIAFSLDLAVHLEDIFIVAFSPGVAYAGGNPVVAITAGLSLTPF